MSTCFICKKHYRDGHIFNVPKDEPRRKRWSDVCHLKFPMQAKVCAAHFAASDFINPPGAPNSKRARLLPGAVPSVNQCEETKRLVDRCTQTDDEVVVANFITENILLKTKLKAIEKQLQETESVLQSLRQKMEKVFTEGQLRKMEKENEYIQWGWDDISPAICLHAAGPRAYRHLYKKGFPLPCESTLVKWARQINVDAGIQPFALDCLKNAIGLEDDDKLCVVSFDEMKISSTYEYDSTTDMVRAPCNYVQVAIARGLKTSWKQPIFYNFDCRMTKDIIFDIITALYAIGYKVVAIVSDMGPTNQGLWKQLEVSTERTWFPNPSNATEKVFVFADVPHLLKLVRNHFLDSGVMWNDQIISPQTIRQVLNYTSGSDISITYKVSEEHLSVHNSDRQKVKMATQLFSHTTASAIRRVHALGMELYNPLATADFVQLMNDWFDIMNAKVADINTPTKKPYGKELQYQDNILERMDDLMKMSILPGKRTLPPFQKGILITNSSLRALLEYLKQKYGMEYLLTYRLNQDILENFFSAIRSKGGMNDHPSPMDFKFRFRKYLLARNTELLSNTSNVEADNTEWLNTAVPSAIKRCNESEATLNLGASCSNSVVCGTDPAVTLCLDDEINELHEDGLEYVAGYIMRKLKLENNLSRDGTWTWVDEISKGRLKKPSVEFLQQIKALEHIFHQFNGTSIAHCANIRSQLMHLSSKILLPEEVKLLFFKCRVFFRVKSLNKRLKAQKIKQRILGNNKLLKILM